VREALDEAEADGGKLAVDADAAADAVADPEIAEAAAVALGAVVGGGSAGLLSAVALEASVVVASVARVLGMIKSLVGVG